MNFNDLKLYLIIVVAGATLWFAKEAYEYNKLQNYLNNIEENQKTIKQSKELTFDQQLELAMERQRKFQIASNKNKADKYMREVRSKYTKEGYEEKLAVCNYFTDLYKKNRTKENELKYVKACDPIYH
ncbi:hypothetical protein H5154_02460 [Pseudoalteromonas sp. SR44-5]|uniref:hypothetical protein n=1 Tax=Pseudoalteromonas TaxID=53246 RepID=UPI001601E3C5|nr:MULTISPECIES: hypothetical protein [unclassified Pseudoalteromonas]MBB1340328.1 hypothetical protein [Pseudoalteromonas sp. SR45-6]MBB1365259.1 hypothetical protein [Pseudoalteromonas sp. SR44-5]